MADQGDHPDAIGPFEDIMSPVGQQRKSQENFRGPNKEWRVVRVMSVEAGKAYAANPKEHGLLAGNKPPRNNLKEQTNFVLNFKCNLSKSGCSWRERMEINTTTNRATLKASGDHDVAIHAAPKAVAKRGLDPETAVVVASISKDLGTTGPKGA